MYDHIIRAGLTQASFKSNHTEVGSDVHYNMKRTRGLLYDYCECVSRIKCTVVFQMQFDIVVSECFDLYSCVVAVLPSAAG